MKKVLNKVGKFLPMVAPMAALLIVGVNGVSTSFAAHGGTNTGSSDRSLTFFQNWCRGAQATLDDAQTDAKISIAQGDFATAKQELVDGLVEALKEKQDVNNPIDQSQSLTYRILTRGLEIASALEDATKLEPMALNDQVDALERYYDFAQRTSRELDVPLFIPFERARALHGPVLDQTAFEQRYEIYAKEELNWVINSFLVVGSNQATGDVSIVYPRGSASAFLKISELVTGYAATDLEDSLFGARYACVAGMLQKLNARLTRYNSGDHSALGDERVGINAIVYPKLRQYADSIQGGCDGGQDQ